MAKTKKYYKVKNLKDAEFKRVEGVKKETFKEMVNVVRKHYRATKSEGGTTRALSVTDLTHFSISATPEKRLD